MPGFERRQAAISLFIWGMAAWLLLTWSNQLEQVITGALLSVLMTAILLPLMDGVVRPWALLQPRRAAAVLKLIAVAAIRIVVANARLTRRIWAPSRPLQSGMVVVGTNARTDAELAAIGLISSLIVDNQLVDLNRDRNELQYHALEVPPAGADRTEVVTAGTERLVEGVVRR